MMRKEESDHKIHWKSFVVWKCFCKREETLVQNFRVKMSFKSYKINVLQLKKFRGLKLKTFLSFSLFSLLILYKYKKRHKNFLTPLTQTKTLLLFTYQLKLLFTFLDFLSFFIFLESLYENVNINATTFLYG